MAGDVFNIVVLQWGQMEEAAVMEPPVPSGFEKVENPKQSLAVGREDIPWLDRDSAQIPLSQVTLRGDGQKFFYGDFICGKKLNRAAGQLDEHRRTIANNLFDSHIPDFIRYGHHPYIKSVSDRVTEKPIYNIHNKGGQRVYFMRFDRLQGIPVVVRVAVCDKDRQGDVLSTLTAQSHKAIKQRGRL